MKSIAPVAFVRGLPPFSSLPDDLFGEAAAALEVSYHAAGAWISRAGGPPLEHLYVIRSGAVRLERDAQVLQVLEEGEYFGYTSLTTGAAVVDVRVEHDLLAYRLPSEQFNRLMADARFASYFAASLGQRLRASLEQSPVATFQVNLGQSVGAVAALTPVWVDPSATVGEAARLMRSAGISSVLVRGEPAGIVTDRDLRGRVLARGQGPDTLVEAVVSRPLVTVDADTPIYQAWSLLLEAGVHHLPLARDREIVGIITSNDVLKATARGPIALRHRVQGYASRDSLAGYSKSVTEMAASLLDGGLDTAVIAGFVARVNDALVGRILAWAEDELGAPPAPYAWMVYGSEGRREQTLLTDQDNALVFADSGEGRRDWYERLALLVSGDLERAGFPPCQGGHMATRWNGSLSSWVRRFTDIVDTPKPHDGALFFDFRRAAGTLELSTLEDVLARAGRNALFLRFLAREALRQSPKAGLVLRLQGDSSRVDLKRHGLAPVAALARCFGLEAGGTWRSTLDRLAGAAGRGLISEESFVSVSEGYRFMMDLRLRRQLRAAARGEAMTNSLSIGDLTPLERSRLKESFRAVKVWQERSAYHYQSDMV